MKNKTFRNILGIFLASMMLVVSCKKEDPIKLDAKVATWEIADITSTTADVSGFVVAEGSGFTENGICWSISEAPTISDNKAQVSDIEKAVYTAQVTGLEHLTSYYVRAYAISSAGTIYGEDMNFTTLAHTATVSIDPITSITAVSATSGGNISYDGKAAVNVRGVCWSTEENPTIEDNITEDGEGTGTFTSEITGLIGGIQYYVRAYATNEIGTSYSSSETFTTPFGVPVVSTVSVQDITKNSAKAYGNAIFTSGADITERGFCWSTSANPTTADNTVASSNGLGEFNADLTGLTAGTEYHVRAYAINSIGTAYGDDIQFTTLANIIIWYIPGDYVAASYPGSTFADWDPANSPQVINTLASPDHLEGYVNMANGSNSWKFASQPNWDGPNYGAGANPGELDANGGNISSNAGYYKLNVDMTTNPMTYTAVATVWGVIGDATPNGWTDETGLTYDAASMTWRGVVHLTAAEFKFRANSSWDYNYGSTAGDATLDAGGSNIALSVESDYDITLDLSTPNQYTYMANLWGIIGDATPGGWDTDTDMTWDAGNSEFTITTDLTVGEFKFRANDAWDYNLGGDIGALTSGGANIAIAADGNYTITLNTMTMVATVTLN